MDQASRPPQGGRFVFGVPYEQSSLKVWTGKSCGFKFR
jgi:hypothetical protein